MNSVEVLVIVVEPFWNWEISDISEIFPSVRNETTVKNQKNQHSSFPIIFSSNEPKERASHCGLNTSGIGQCHIFSIFFEVSEKKFTEKNQRKSIFEF